VKDRRVKVLLFLTIMIMAVLPLTAAFYFLNHALGTSLDLGFNPSIVRALESSSRNLKTLKHLDPGGEDRYKGEFEVSEHLRRVYSSPELVKTGILTSLQVYFGLGVAGAVLLSVLLAGLLSRSIANSYQRTFAELLSHKDRVRYLEEMASWQELAKMLAHEIKNPLTPIEVLMSSLSRAHMNQSEAEFRAHLERTQTMIAEELGHLKSTVNKFSALSRLPSVRLTEEDLQSALNQLVGALSLNFEPADIQIVPPPSSGPIRVNLDLTLFRQVLTNIIRNGLEANPERRVRFSVVTLAAEETVSISISNDGTPVPVSLATRLFEPYVSGKSGSDNMGLGLAIVRKIVIEHGGDIVYTEENRQPVFSISLPRLAS
jgi:signal transduction histidine kinase